MIGKLRNICRHLWLLERLDWREIPLPNEYIMIF